MITVEVTRMLMNAQLSATMLGDNPEKSKNPLKKAIRRRHAKTVQFSTNTYVEASDVDYSTDEDEEHDEERNQGTHYDSGEGESVEGQNDEGEDQDQITAVEPLSVKSQNAAGAGDKTETVETPAQASAGEDASGREQSDPNGEMSDRQGNCDALP